ncbi:unnamed protein product [Pieris brassicae]|uniref:Fibronectin type-III domain-containing protein n=1 Tax=Pieris brassicae TaxID=7116 RepID=A0A9P0XFE1_PIEBR|nr:unnamed protein product [Pieris brassicae]
MILRTESILVLAYIVLVSGIQESQRYLEAPEVTGVSLAEPEGLYVQWWPVRQRNDDPVIGYKIRLWEIPESSTTDIQLVNADKYPGTVKHDESSKSFSVNNTEPISREEIIGSTNKGLISATVKIKYNTIYEVRVLAFKKDVDGPMSLPTRTKVVKGSGYQVVLQRTTTSCRITVPSEVQYENDPYPYEHNFIF